MKEIDRIQQVYQGYHDSGRSLRLWHQDNPGNEAIYKERKNGFRRLLQETGLFPLVDKHILEIGCGCGAVLAEMREWGATAENLFGIDLLPDRIDAARRQYPGIHFDCGNAEKLSFADESFDLVLFLTVFSSILDESMRMNISAEAIRVLKKGGAIFWYDFRFNNPNNPHVRGLGKKDISQLFPGLRRNLCTITLLPPLARRLGKATPLLYPLLASIPFLHTHWIGLMIKE